MCWEQPYNIEYGQQAVLILRGAYVIIVHILNRNPEDEDKIKLFAQIYDKLPSGGMFINYDQFFADQAEMNDWFNSYWENHIENSGLTENLYAE